MNNSKDSVDINDINIHNMFIPNEKKWFYFLFGLNLIIWKARIIKYPILTGYIKDSDGYKYLTMLIDVKSSSIFLKYKNI